MNDLDAYIKGFSDEKLQRLTVGLVREGYNLGQAQTITRLWVLDGWSSLLISEQRACLRVVGTF